MTQHHTDSSNASQLLSDWKENKYTFGRDVLAETGSITRELGKKALLVVTGLGHTWAEQPLGTVKRSLDAAGVDYNIVLGAAPNAPREDVYRIANEISRFNPDVVVAFGGGSTIDAVKCSSALSVFSPDEMISALDASPRKAGTVEPLFGAGNVTKLCEATGKSLHPIVAVQTVSSSAAHLTKYSNITDPLNGQKKLIIDMAAVPPRAVFDYGITLTTPRELTLDGGMDGVSHLWEVFMGATGKEYYGKVEEIVIEGLTHIIGKLPVAAENPADIDARVSLGYGTDLGGYAIMVGGTNGGHLGSFSLVDVTSHGRACAILNPYYTVFFSQNIEPQLRAVGEVYRQFGYIENGLDSLGGRELGEAVAKGMIAFAGEIGFPSTLEDIGATEKHINRMAEAAKNPQLDSKLKNMPTPLDAGRGDIDTYMRPILEAAFTGDLTKIKMMK